MPKPKAEPADTRTQRQKFIDKARELGTDDSERTFERTLTAIASAPMAKAKKAAPKSKK
jgi:hypothetical protein